MERENCLWYSLLCPSPLSGMVLQLQSLIVCWLLRACRLNSRLIWLQIHHRYISLCWVSLMPHIKRRGGHRGSCIKPNTTGSQPKWKRALNSSLIFVSLTNSVLYLPIPWKTGVRESKVIKGSHLKKKEDETMSVTRANEGMGKGMEISLFTVVGGWAAYEKMLRRVITVRSFGT